MVTPEAEPPRITLAAGSGAGERLDAFIARCLKAKGIEVSRSRVQQWIALGAVQWLGQPLSNAYRLRGPEAIDVDMLPREADSSFAPDPVALDVVGQSRDWLVIHKPAGLVVHPGAGHWRQTLMNGLLYHFPDHADLPRAGLVHRLDKDTSGLLVVARNARAQASFIAQLADRTMGRMYLAWCEGLVAPAMRFDTAIGRDPRHPLRMTVRTDGKPALTQVLRLASREGAAPISLVACKLHTGRTHQIRVHLSQAGHPVVGDVLYGARAGLQMRQGQALHAWHLQFKDPADGTVRAFTAPLAADLEPGPEGIELDPITLGKRFEALAQ